MWRELTADEIAAGLHYCPECDYKLIGPNDPESAMCDCGPDDAEDQEDFENDSPRIFWVCRESGC